MIRVIAVVGIRLILSHTHGNYMCRGASTTQVASRPGPESPVLYMVSAETVRVFQRVGRVGASASKVACLASVV